MILLEVLVVLALQENKNMDILGFKKLCSDTLDPKEMQSMESIRAINIVLEDIRIIERQMAKIQNDDFFMVKEDIPYFSNPGLEQSIKDAYITAGCGYRQHLITQFHTMKYELIKKLREEHNVLYED